MKNINTNFFLFKSINWFYYYINYSYQYRGVICFDEHMAFVFL